MSQNTTQNLNQENINHLESIILGGGCFWCLDAIFVRIEGVCSVTSGYSGGDIPSPSYREICTGQTNHAEVVKVDFDPTIISLSTILEIFWTAHNPTTLNQQGHDKGTQYRSAIYYFLPAQKEAIDQSVKDFAIPAWGESITTQIIPAPKFYPAEEYHQKYFDKNPTQGYCNLVINPKLQKLKKYFKE